MLSFLNECDVVYYEMLFEILYGYKLIIVVKYMKITNTHSFYVNK